MSGGDQTQVRLSKRERVLLCDEISRFSLLLGREAQNSREGETVGAAFGASQAESSPLERLRLLTNLWPRLETALHAIAARPDSALISVSQSLPIHMARGNVATLAHLARDPADHCAWAQSNRQADTAPPVRIHELRPIPTVQTAANRIATHFLKVLASETQALQRLALFCEEPAAAAVADRMHRNVRRWLQKTPFCECYSPVESGPFPAFEALLRCSPAYRSLYTILRAVEAGLSIDWSDSAVLRFPLLEEWHLFEMWCFLRVGIALREIGWKAVETDCLQIVATGLRLRLAHGKASRIRFRAPNPKAMLSPSKAELDLMYQPLYPSANRTSALAQTGFRSLSHVMQPDIAVVQNGRLLLLDPKYRPYGEFGAEQEDVDKMHAYRDAIVRTDANTGRTAPAVDAAWCLFPGIPAPASSLQDRLRAYPASTPNQPFGTAGVGALQVRPGLENTALEALLRHWLGTVS